VKRLASLRFRFGPYQIRQALHSGQVKLAILESPPRELARSGWAESFDGAKRREHCCNDGVSPVKVEFRGVLAGFASRAWKPQNEGVIDRFERRLRMRAASIAAWNLEPEQRRLPRLRQTSGKRHDGVAGRRTTDAHHGNRGRWPAG
jgi:hypothetical protein